ncbi:hypothetical protein [Streptomyces atratus]|nr:hypothetical protein [Streptomyces atratus]MCX5342936.1 hypothetical protein [Streptomyces atratus]
MQHIYGAHGVRAEGGVRLAMDVKDELARRRYENLANCLESPMRAALKHQ